MNRTKTYHFASGLAFLVSYLIIVSCNNSGTDFKDSQAALNDDLQLKKRRQYLQQLLITTKEETGRLHSLGKCVEVVEKHKKIIGELTEADYENLEGLPGSFYSTLAIRADQCDNPEEAISAYKKAIEIFEENSLFNVATGNAKLLGMLYERLGNLQNAEIQYRKAIAFADLTPVEGKECLDFDAIDARIHLFRFYEKMGRLTEADELADELSKLRDCIALFDKEVKEYLENQLADIGEMRKHRNLSTNLMP